MTQLSAISGRLADGTRRGSHMWACRCPLPVDGEWISSVHHAWPHVCAPRRWPLRSMRNGYRVADPRLTPRSLQYRSYKGEANLFEPEVRSATYSVGAALQSGFLSGAGVQKPIAAAGMPRAAALSDQLFLPNGLT